MLLLGNTLMAHHLSENQFVGLKFKWSSIIRQITDMRALRIQSAYSYKRLIFPSGIFIYDEPEPPAVRLWWQFLITIRRCCVLHRIIKVFYCCTRKKNQRDCWLLSSFIKLQRERKWIIHAWNFQALLFDISFVSDLRRKILLQMIPLREIRPRSTPSRRNMK